MHSEAATRMSIELINITLHDGSRNFMELLTGLIGWTGLYKYLGKLSGVKKTGFLTDYVTEVWMDFTYRGHIFSVNNQMGEYWFFVEDPNCPEEILIEVVNHFRKLLEK